MKRMVPMLAAAVAVAITVSGCGGTAGNRKTGGEKTSISVSWPSKSSEVTYNEWNERAKKFVEKYPDIVIVPDEWQYSTETFLPKAASGTLPTLYSAPFTEIDKLVTGGYAADLTDAMKQYQYTEHLSDEILELISRDGKQYFVPTEAYTMGLFINHALFEQAGELDANGNVTYPQTLDELGALAGRIKSKTGQAGFILPTMNNVGGWHFLNIAWAYGTEFMKLVDGKWVATFDSDACAAALQFVKDLKWKYNALSDNTFIDYAEAYKSFAIDQGAMVFGTPSTSTLRVLTNDYKMDKSNLYVGTIPAGPKGKFAQVGGNVMAIKNGATPKEIDAVFKWLAFSGNAANLTDEIKAIRESTMQSYVADGRIIGFSSNSLWKSGENQRFVEEMNEKYRNIDRKQFSDFTFHNVTLKSEEPVSCQELYGILDSCIQEVLNNENADIKEILKRAANDFQINFLDKAE